MCADNSEKPQLTPAPRCESSPTPEGTPKVRYCVITPVRDEEQYILGTIKSVLDQSVRPVEWIIVDDGSKDATGVIIDRYTQEYSWIRTLHRKDRGHRATGGGVEAFLDAYRLLQSHDWEYLVNLDSDLTFAPDYFERCFEYFHKTPSLGIGGGAIYTMVGDLLSLEKAPTFHVRGATKIYRRECWEELGGLFCGLGWDTVDEVKANQLGWTTRTFADLRLVHQRASGAVWGKWGSAVNDGEADYIVGYHPLFFCFKCGRHIFNSPYLIRSLGIAYGFLRGLVRGTPRIEDRALVAYLRNQQLRRLVGVSSIWK